MSCLFEDSNSTLQNTINWNGCISSEFAVSNSVKQGAVLSPLALFAVYLDDLLQELRNAEVGCHVNGMFTGAFIYADDITLIVHLEKVYDICCKYVNNMLLSMLFYLIR